MQREGGAPVRNQGPEIAMLLALYEQAALGLSDSQTWDCCIQSEVG